MLAPLILPRDLSGVAEQLTAAIREIEVPGEWPGEKFVQAHQASAIASALVGAVHTHLTSAHIAYLFREQLAGHNCVVYGKAAKAAGLLEFLSGFDFTVMFNWTEWIRLTPPQRIALVDHELTHCIRGETSWDLVGHDVEEFGAIVGRWGLWRPSLRAFQEAMSRSQHDLFADIEQQAADLKERGVTVTVGRG